MSREIGQKLARLLPGGSKNVRTPADRRVLFTLFAVAIVAGGFFIYQIITSIGDNDEPKASDAKPANIGKTPAIEDSQVQDDGLLETEPSPAPADPKALDVGRRFLDAYLRPNVERDEWYRALRRFCEPDLCRQLNDIDPDQVKQHKITGQPQIVDSRTTYVLLDFPTDIGAFYSLTVGRLGDEWKVYQLELTWR